MKDRVAASDMLLVVDMTTRRRRWPRLTEPLIVVEADDRENADVFEAADSEIDTDGRERVEVGGMT